MLVISAVFDILGAGQILNLEPSPVLDSRLSLQEASSTRLITLVDMQKDACSVRGMVKMWPQLGERNLL